MNFAIEIVGLGAIVPAVVSFAMFFLCGRLLRSEAVRGCRRSRRGFCCWIRAVAFLGGTHPAATLALATMSGCCSHDPGPTQLGGRSC